MDFEINSIIDHVTNEALYPILCMWNNGLLEDEAWSKYYDNGGDSVYFEQVWEYLQETFETRAIPYLADKARPFGTFSINRI